MPIVKVPPEPTIAEPRTWLLLPMMVTVLPGSALPVTMVPSRFTEEITAAAGGVVSTVMTQLSEIALLPALFDALTVNW